MARQQHEGHVRPGWLARYPGSDRLRRRAEERLLRDDYGIRPLLEFLQELAGVPTDMRFEPGAAELLGDCRTVTSPRRKDDD